MNVRQRIRKGREKSIDVYERICRQPETSPRLIRWLRGRIAWEMGRKRNGEPT